MNKKKIIKSLVVIVLIALAVDLVAYGRRVIFGGGDKFGDREIISSEEANEIYIKLSDCSFESFLSECWKQQWEQVNASHNYICALHKDCIVSISLNERNEKNDYYEIYNRTWDGFNDYIHGNFVYENIVTLITDEYIIRIIEHTKIKNSDSVEEAMNKILTSCQ